MTQVGSETKYTIVLTLTGSGGTSNYPELNCTGKLTRIGASHSYVFYIEVITEGQREKGGRCPDGTSPIASDPQKQGNTEYEARAGIEH